MEKVTSKPHQRESALVVSLHLVALAFLLCSTLATAQAQQRRTSVAILDLNPSTVGRLAADKLASNLKNVEDLSLLDRDQVRAAARGAGYEGSLNLSLIEARNLGAALGCDFFIIGDAQTLRRSPSTGGAYFESYASLLLVSARTGKLITWERPNFRATEPADAEQSLLKELTGNDIRERLAVLIQRALADERVERDITIDRETPVIEQAPDDDQLAEAEGLRLPRPYRRLVPAYPETASQAEAEGIVDVLVDLDSKGDVTNVSIARWAGFGLDNSTINTVRRLHFFPAMRNGVAIPIRVLLRYNFRKPPR
ncbi:MAG TPA: energy transducer TonB [Pyrinomonadaceae bacterium]|nr:energy transducer TonB [Pyrinomonadaceae bacterium]